MLRCPHCKGTRYIVYQNITIKYPSNGEHDFLEEKETTYWGKDCEEFSCWDCDAEMLDDESDEWEEYFREEDEDD